MTLPRMILAVALLMPALSTATPAQGATCQVNTNDEGDVPMSLRRALADPQCDLIQIPSSIGTIDLLSRLPDIDRDLTITGLGPVTIRRNPNAAGDFRIFRIKSGRTVVLSGLTITGGRADALVTVPELDPPLRLGGGIANEGTLTISNCTFSENVAATNGGAIWTSGPSLMISNSTFDANEAGSGGAIAQDIPSYFQSFWGTVTGLPPYAAPATLTIADSTFRNNRALTLGGGAIFSDGGHIVVTRTGFVDNTAGGFGGGAIYLFHGNLEIENSTLRNNHSLEAGGGVTLGGYAPYDLPPSPYPFFRATLRNTAFIENTAVTAGGAIYTNDTNAYPFASAVIPLDITNSTFYGNTALVGGAIEIAEASGTSTIESNTFAQNTASARASAVGMMATDLKNNIFASDLSGTARHCQDSRTGAIAVGSGGNISTDDSCSSDRQWTDPLLGPLAANGGPSLTMSPHRGSPAIDAAWGDCPATDQRGALRPQHAGCDIGAFEVIVSFDCPSSAAQVGVPYNSGLVGYGGLAAHGYLAVMRSGTLPPGLILTQLGGAIGGTPTAAGTFTFAVQVVGLDAPTVASLLDRATNVCSIDVTEPPSQIDQAITVTTPAPASAAYDTTFTVAATAPGGPVTYSSSGSCTNTGATFTMIDGTGTCTVTYDQDGNSSYSAAPQVTSSTTASKANQAALTLYAGSPLTYDVKEPLSTSGGTGSGAVTFSLTSGPCTVSDSQLTANSGSGTCVVAATKAGDSNYNDGIASATVALQKASQSIAFAQPTSPATYGTTFDVSASSNSMLAVSIAATGGCSISGGTVEMTSGTIACKLTASEAGNGNYRAATDVVWTVNAAQGMATLTLADLLHTYDGSPRSATVMASPAGLTGITITYDGSSTAPVNAGAYAVVATLSNQNYAAVAAHGTLSIGNPSPVASNVTPRTALAGSPELDVELTGTGFVPASVVRWNGNDLATAFVSSTRLRLTVPAALLAHVATAELVVRNPLPGGGDSELEAFFVTAKQTAVTAIASGTSDTPAGAAVAEVPGVVKAEAAGTGTIVIADYSANPGDTPAFVSGNDYFDVYVSTDNTFSQTTVELCGAGQLAYWWNGTDWALASEQRHDNGCVIITITDETSPSLDDLHGTPFALGERAATTFSNLSSPTSVYGTEFTTISGLLSSTTSTPTGQVTVTVDGESREAAIDANGSFTVSFPTVNLVAGGHPIAFRYEGSDSFEEKTANGTLTISKAPGAVSIGNIPATATVGGSFTPTYARLGDGILSTSSSTPGTCTVVDGSVGFVGVGTCRLRAAVEEGTNHLAATGSEQSFSIGTAATMTMVHVDSSQRQYSDRVQLQASVSSTAPGTISGTVQFRLNGTSVGSPQPLVNGTATLSYLLSQSPAAYQVTAVFTSTHAHFAGSTSSATALTVAAEDAHVAYTGLEFVATPSARETTAQVMLSATVRDITAVDPAQDGSAGDIRNARVQFTNRDTGQVLCSGLVPNLVGGDTKVGTVACTVPLGVGSTGGTAYTIGVIVSHYYGRNSRSDDVTVMVALPISSMITGGGHSVATASAGEYAAAPGSKTNFGFNVKYNKSMTNLQGSATIILRAAGGKVYAIKANAMRSLVADVPNGTASLMSKANLTDISDPGQVVPMGGNFDLQMSLKDNGTPGSLDTVAMTLRSSSGALLFSSRWNGVNTVEQPINGGNVVVK